MINYTIAACLASALVGAVVTYGLCKAEIGALKRKIGIYRMKRVQLENALYGLHNRYRSQKSGTARYVARVALGAVFGSKNKGDA